MAMSFPFLLIILFSGGGGLGGDLLDFIRTDAYWLAQDQRVVDVATMSAVLDDEDATAADHLMAIRALGEVGRGAGADKQAALAVLGPQVDSNDPFVATYARRSIAWIKGEDPEPRPRVTAQQIAGDLALLPHTSSIVGQVRIDNGVGPTDLAALIPDFGDGGFGPDRGEMLQDITDGAIDLSAMIGNARLDAVSFGMGIGERGPAPLMVVARGQYDRLAVQMAFEMMAEEGGGNDWSFYSIGEVEVVANNSEWEQVAFLMPSDELFIVLVGEGGAGAPLPIEETADLLAHGDAQPAFNEAITPQIAAIDREHADFWLAIEVTPVLKAELGEVLGPFDAGRAVGLRDEQGAMQVSWSATGQDAEAVTQTVQMLNAELTHARQEMRQELQQNKEMRVMMQPLIDMMDSLHLESDGDTMTGGLTLKDGIGAMLPMMFLGF